MDNTTKHRQVSNVNKLFARRNEMGALEPHVKRPVLLSQVCAVLFGFALFVFILYFSVETAKSFESLDPVIIETGMVPGAFLAAALVLILLTIRQHRKKLLQQNPNPYLADNFNFLRAREKAGQALANGNKKRNWISWPGRKTKYLHPAITLQRPFQCDGARNQKKTRF